MGKKPYEHKKITKPGDYAGILTTPMKYFSAPSGNEEPSPEMAGQLLERLMALYEHFKINPRDENASSKLVMALALKHVKGFKMLRPKQGMVSTGPKKKWKGTEGVDLYIETQRVIQKESCGGPTAIKYVVNDKESRWKGMKRKSLYSRYKEVTKFLGQPRCEKLNKIISDQKIYPLVDAIIHERMDDGTPILHREDALDSFIRIGAELNKNG